MKLVNKKFVESKEAPNNTNVYWIDYDESSKGKILDIKEYINGNWQSVLNVNSPEFTIDISQITGLGENWLNCLTKEISSSKIRINGNSWGILSLDTTVHRPPGIFTVSYYGNENDLVVCKNSAPDAPDKIGYSDTINIPGLSTYKGAARIGTDDATSYLYGNIIVPKELVVNEALRVGSSYLHTDEDGYFNINDGKVYTERNTAITIVNINGENIELLTPKWINSKTIFCPTSGGTEGNVLVSSGDNKAPKFSDRIVLSNLVTDDIQLSGDISFSTDRQGINWVNKRAWLESSISQDVIVSTELANLMGDISIKSLNTEILVKSVEDRTTPDSLIQFTADKLKVKSLSDTETYDILSTKNFVANVNYITPEAFEEYKTTVNQLISDLTSRIEALEAKIT